MSHNGIDHSVESAVQSSRIETEDVACDLCGARNAAAVIESRDYWHGLAGTFIVVRCRPCGLMYLNPRPTERSIAAFYPADYYAYSPSNGPAPVRMRTRIKRLVRSRRLLSEIAVLFPGLRDAGRDFPIREDIPEWIPPGRLLDVGCGSGGLLDTMVDMGWQAVGLEPNADACAAARARGHQVLCQSASDPLPPDAMFDLISVSHTLEHLHSPRRALTCLRKALRPTSGRIVIEVPNVESLFTRLFQGLGTAFDTPRHLYLFAPATLNRLMIETGFKVERMRHRSDARQIVKSFTLVSKLFGMEDMPNTGDSILKDQELLATFKPLVDLASARSLGGAMRITATRAE